MYSFHDVSAAILYSVFQDHRVLRADLVRMALQVKVGMWDLQDQLDHLDLLVQSVHPEEMESKDK